MNNERKNNVLRENLEICEKRRNLLLKQYRLCADTLALSLCNEFPSASAEELYLRFKEIVPINDAVITAILCRHIASKKETSSSYISESLFSQIGMNDSPTAGSHGRISYVRNRYNDFAYERFSEIVRNAKFSYAPSFVQSCEDVINGVCEYVILPIENTSDGRLFGFYSMLDRYELRICAVTTIENDEALNVQYALVGKTVPRRLKKEENCNFEFSISREDDSRLVDFLRVAHEFSAIPKKIDTLRLEYDQELYKYYFTFCIPCNEAYAFSLYLSLEYPNYTPIGLYPTEE